MGTLAAGARLRVAGSAFLVFGRVALQRPGGKAGAELAGPTILPALPAIYIAQTAIKARSRILVGFRFRCRFRFKIAVLGAARRAPELAGPTILPALPAIYIAQTAIKARSWGLGLGL